MELDTLEHIYPWIAWREPIKVLHTDGIERWACRICIGSYGLKGSEVKDLYLTPEEVLEHIEAFHLE